jgi:hypothetical protein
MIKLYKKMIYNKLTLRATPKQSKLLLLIIFSPHKDTINLLINLEKRSKCKYFSNYKLR